MIKEAKGFENEHRFDFYSYDHSGRDVVIKIWAQNSKDAWTKFDRVYGDKTPVDMVIEKQD